MNISKERRRILLDARDVESSAGILTISHDASSERSLKTANRALHAAANITRVLEGDTWWTGLTLRSLVDVGCCIGGRAVVTLEVVQADVVADDVVVRVQGEPVPAGGSLEATSGSCAVDDLVGKSLDFVVAGEAEGAADLRLVASLACSTGIVDRFPSSRRSGVGVEVLAGSLGILHRLPASRRSWVRSEVLACALRVLDRFPAT